MNASQTHVDAFTLLRDPGDDSVLSYRHRVLADRAANDAPPGSDSYSVLRRVESGDLEVVTDPNVGPTIPTCLECGCTEQFACEGGCSWAGPNVCSSCLAPQMKPRDEIENKLEAMQRQRDLTGYERLAVMQIELLLDIRDLLSAAFVPPTLRGTPEQIARLKELFAEDAPRGRILTLGDI